MDVTPHLPLVRHIAGGFRKRLPPQVEFEDLVQAGVLGLLDAATRYDETNAASFATFAGHRIGGAIRDYLRAQDPLTRNQRERNRDLSANSQLSQYGDVFRAPDVPENDCIYRQWLYRGIRALPIRERRVVQEYYFGERFLRDIGHDLGVSESRAIQLRDKALSRLRQGLPA